MLTNNTIYSASLGDSRAILAASAPPGQFPVPKAINHDNSKHMYLASTSLFPVQLTKDQKPDDPDELARILECNGRIKQIIDGSMQGGPYRVYDGSGNCPGLSMSRSIGDACYNSIGIISIPICTIFSLSGKEKFIVLASDGVWDVMDNEDVAIFVDTYRRKCRSVCSPPVEVTSSSTTIAQLLCEEARMRWLNIISDEDAVIDDISSIVLEFKEGD